MRIGGGMRGVVFIAALAVLGGCSSQSTSREGTPILVSFDLPDLKGDGAHHVVSIIDNGFDLSLPVYEGKIAGGYTITCDASPAPAPPTSFDEARARAISEYAVKNTRCHLVPGITLRKSSSLEAAAPDLREWNASIARHDPQSKLARIADAAGGEHSYDYHGTWTSSLIAYKNPNVWMVFVENAAQERGGTAPTCAPSASLDRAIALLQDPDVRAAALAAPSSSLSDDFAAMYRHHGVTLQNESFGPFALAKLQAACPSIAGLLETYATLAAESSGQRQHASNDAEYAGVSLLNVRAAGNDGANLASMVDHIACPSDPRNVSYGTQSVDIMVGSSTASGGAPQISSFSNTGGCVPFYAPGEHIVSQSAGGFLNVLSGTSFAAPLVVRHLSLTPPGTTPAAMRDQLTQKTQFLPSDWFPAELLYDQATPNAPIDF